MHTKTYRVDWLDAADPTGSTVGVSYHSSNLDSARRKARKVSKDIGSAYVIMAIDGVDISHLPYTDGVACIHGWDNS